MERRDFLKTATAASVSAAIPLNAQTSPPPTQTTKRPESPDMIYRELGTTGERVSAIGMGGYHLGKQKDSAESIQLLHAGIDRGITFLDNCWDYNDGISEVRMGQALRNGYRQKVFLMTKMDGRTADEYNKQLEQSLGRLQTDMIDLVQFHEVIRMEDPDRIFAPGGAIEAAVAARKAGKIRYIGFTGHKDPVVHLRMLETAQKHGFHFDTVQMPINVMDAHFRSFEKEVMPVALKQGIGILAMKTFGDPYILKSNTVQPIEALHYSLTQPVSVVITGIDNTQTLDQAFEATRTFKPLDQAQITALLSRTATAASEGKFELFKTTTHYDGTAANPKWLG
ncbi:aldo/keto reductase [Tunturiibacter gelidoferens]|jgi:aryl-alcohol dehydrogenase-like predicted oxidoreductase|uniref:Aryl-alcohol dehydrogenase-like predicted oxidoreductase n=1 Tax=Tunturiibacter gelidiferens TaxID=3069689 RepID=A0A9X0QJP8_9BACT|nr:aldo/keto reductase [Edaphobacter lichenicola]MBB5331349.1 aryl-alcohol dehydrogenase-like predicted oxidoreductase [Edaphobacter lichenicola]